METRYLSCAETAKLVRKALKEGFPGVKFSVRSKVYSGGASISVGWMDSPTEKAVEEVTEQFQGADFDGMIDLKTYRKSYLNGERVSFGADFIFCNRDYSVGLLTEIANRVTERRGLEPLEVKQWEDGGAYVEDKGIRLDNVYLRELIWRECGKTEA